MSAGETLSDFDHNAQRALAYAQTESEEHRRAHIGSEDLLVGLLLVDNGRAAQVLQAVRSAARGEVVVPPYMLARLLHGMQRKATPVRSTPLTPKELQVMNQLVRGQDNETVARSLTMSPNTVRTHVQNILAKLGVHSKLEAVSLALREGWVRIPQEPAA